MKYKPNKYTVQEQQHGKHANFHMERYIKHCLAFFFFFFKICFLYINLHEFMFVQNWQNTAYQVLKDVFL